MREAKKIIYTLFITMIFTAHGSAHASSIGLQDIYIFGQITNVTESIDINSQVITHLNNNSTSSKTLPGGVRLTATTITGRISNASTGAIRDTDGFASMGILEFNGNQNIIAIASTRLSANEALGRNFNVELDLSGVNNVHVGDAISHEYISLRTYSTDTDPIGDDPFGVFTNRIQEGSFTASGLFQDGLQAYDEDLLAMSFSTSEIIDGSTFWRYFGKALEVTGETLGGGLAGAGAGAGIGAAVTSPSGPGAAAGAGVGAIFGGLIGGGAGFLHGVGGALKDNNQIDPPKPVPVPAAVWLFGSGLIGLVGMIKKPKSYAENLGNGA